MYKALYLSPMVPSYNIHETCHFFTDLLGFSPIMESETYDIVQKNNLTIHILPAGNEIGQMEFYLEVDDIEVIWNSIQNKVKGLKVREPFDREYGMREIHIEVPQTKTLLFIGQGIKK
jgi:hypothetical protein